MEDLLYEEWTRRLKENDNSSIEPCKDRNTKQTCAIGSAASLVGLDRDDKSQQPAPCEWRDVPDTTWSLSNWSGKMMKCVPCVEADAKKLYEFATGTGDYKSDRKRDGMSDRNVGLPALIQKDKTLLNKIVKHLPLIPLHGHIRNLAAELFPADGHESARISVEGVRADDLAFQFYFLARLYQAGGTDGGRDKNWVAHGMATDPGRLGEAVELVRCMPITLGQKLETLSTLFDLPPPLEHSPTPPVKKPRDTKPEDGARAGPSWRHAILAALLLLPSASAATAPEGRSIAIQTGPGNSGTRTPSHMGLLPNNQIFDSGLLDSGYGLEHSTDITVITGIHKNMVTRAIQRVATIESIVPSISNFLQARNNQLKKLLGLNGEYMESDALIMLTRRLGEISKYIQFVVYTDLKKLLEKNKALQSWSVAGVTINGGYSLNDVTSKIEELHSFLKENERGQGFDAKLFGKVIATAWFNSREIIDSKDGYPIQDYAFPLIRDYLLATGSVDQPGSLEASKIYIECRYLLPMLLNKLQGNDRELVIQGFVHNGGIVDQQEITDKIVRSEGLSPDKYTEVNKMVGKFVKTVQEHAKNKLIDTLTADFNDVKDKLIAATSMDAYANTTFGIMDGLLSRLRELLIIIGVFIIAAGLGYVYVRRGAQSTKDAVTRTVPAPSTEHKPLSYSIPAPSTEHDVKVKGVYRIQEAFRFPDTQTFPHGMYFEVTKVHDGNKQIDGYIIMELKNQFRGGMKTIYQRSRYYKIISCGEPRY